MKKISLKLISFILALITVFLALLMAVSCSDKKEENEEKAPQKMNVLVENGETKYKVVRSEDASKDVVQLAVNLRESIQNAFNCSIPIASDWLKPDEQPDPDANEIIVGDTNREASKEVKSTLGQNEWAVVDNGTQVVICANGGDEILALAVNWFIETYVENGKEVLEIPEKLDKREGAGDSVILSMGGISSASVVYPKGNENLKYMASLVQRHIKVNDKKIKLIDDSEPKSGYEIVIGKTKRDDETVTGAGQYKVSVSDDCIKILGSDETALYYALNYFLEYGVEIKDTMVTVSKDYSLSGTLTDYTSSSWEMPIPYLSASKIAPMYNIGAGLENDKNQNTVTDSQMHLVSSANKAMFEGYGERLKSFGFKDVHTSNTDANVLKCYVLGEALVYVHFSPKQATMRVIWDKSSTCPVTKVDNKVEGNGSTEFYQYSLDYTNAPLNLTGQGINCGMLYIVKLSDNSLILVDSGHNNQSKDESLQGIYDFLYEITRTEPKQPLHIRFWYFTHADGDHNELVTKFFNYLDRKGLKFPIIDTIGHAYPSERANEKFNKTSGAYAMLDFMRERYFNTDFIKLHTGMVFNINEVTFEVISTVENLVDIYGQNPANYGGNDNCSVIRFHFGGKSILMQGDQGTDPQKYLLQMYDDGYFKSDVIQVSHHGFNKTYDMFDRIKPQYAFFPNAEKNVSDPVKKYLLTDVGPKNMYYAGDYTYGFKVVDGQIVITQYLRYDNPNKT